jgi:NAD(P)-dependent dehydrogenase (short-subunit alcohol dehydrogenase family)
MMAVKEFGRIDYAVNSAGVSLSRALIYYFLDIHKKTDNYGLTKIDLENYGSFTPALDLNIFTKRSDTNIVGAVRLTRTVMKGMGEQEPLTFPGAGRRGSRSLGRGSIILLGSITSLVGAPGMISYTTAKHAIIGIVRSAG